MIELNKFQGSGRLTRDPESRQAGNTTVASASVAIGRSWKDKQSGERREETSFFTIEAWGNAANVLLNYFKKGDAIFIEDARLKQETWEKDGQKHERVKIVMERFQFGESKRDKEARGSGGGYGGGYGQGQGQQQNQDQPAGDSSDDLPF